MCPPPLWEILKRVKFATRGCAQVHYLDFLKFTLKEACTCAYPPFGKFSNLENFPRGIGY